MPRYYFHLHNGLDVIDEEGRELPDLEAARRAAVIDARQMAAESVRLGHLDLSHYLEVTDETGKTLFRTPFGAAVTVV
jgi:hypothetical protein